MAAKIVQGKIKHQRINGKLVQITRNQRQKWLHIAEQTAKTIQKITSNLNEKEIYTSLNELEKLINEKQTAKFNPKASHPSIPNKNISLTKTTPK